MKSNQDRAKYEKYRSEDGTSYDDRDSMKRSHDRLKHEKYSSEGRISSRINYDADKGSFYGSAAAAASQSDSHYNKRRPSAPKMSEKEQAARLREMQENAEMHEEQRWKRLKKAEEDDAREATRDGVVSGKNFLDAAQKSVYGAEKGGSSTIEERVRRRTYYSQGREASEGHAFRR